MAARFKDERSMAARFKMRDLYSPKLCVSSTERSVSLSSSGAR